MAKLNVEIPAVNVKVDGVEYRKVERKAQAGDIVKIVNCDEHPDVTTGGFYKVNRIDSSGDARLTGNDGRDYDTVGDTLEVYEKVAEMAVLPEPTFKRGDVVRPKSGVPDWTTTLIERAPEFDGRYGPAWKHSHDSGWIGEVQFELVAETAQPDVVVHEGRRYRKVARKANVGDLAIIVANTGSNRAGCHGFNINDVVESVGNTDRGNMSAKVTGRIVVRNAVSADDYVVLEPLETVTEVKRHARVGERIRIVKYDHSTHTIPDRRVRLNDEFTVKHIDTDGDVWYVEERSIDGLFYYGRGEYVVLENVEPTPAPKVDRLKVGEYAKAVGPQPHALFRKEGDLVTIAEDDKGSRPFRTIHLDGTEGGWAYVTDLVRATDAEVAAAKAEIERKEAEAAVTAKWSAIGRNVNEFKTGDIVIAQRSVGSDEFIYGEVEDARQNTEKRLGLRTPNGSYFATYSDGAKLVTPVEQRFDKR